MTIYVSKETEDIAKKMTGGGLIFIGNHIYIMIDGYLYLYVRTK